jgi:hypothetical protein
MGGKLRELENKGKAVGLKINATKTKTMRINAKSKERFKVNNKDVDDFEQFTYLGSVVTTGGTKGEVKIRVRKANAASIWLHPVWKAKEIATKSKMMIFSNNVEFVLLYGCETL